MLTIRDAQMAAFSQAAMRRFEDWMLRHLRQFFPAQCLSLDETALRELVRYGIARASTHGITMERDVCKYIDLNTVFGRDFDTDTRFPWAARVLRRIQSPTTKIQSLYWFAKTGGGA